MAKTVKSSAWVPKRQDIIWIDCNPQAGQEMRDIHPFLVLSPRNFNDKTSLVIGLPMTTAEYNADNPFAVTVAKKAKRKIEQTSYASRGQVHNQEYLFSPQRVRSITKSFYGWYRIYINRPLI